MFGRKKLRRIVSVILSMAIVFTGIITPTKTHADTYQQFKAYKTALGSPATLMADPLVINKDGKEDVVYCYNYTLDYPRELREGGTDGYMHDHFTNINDANKEKLLKIIYHGYPNNSSEDYRGI